MAMDTLEGSFFFSLMPFALRREVLRDRVQAMDLVHQIMRYALESDEFEQHHEANDLTDLASTIASTLVSALNPLAQRLMANMPPHERISVMSWLSDPTPVKRAMMQLLERLLLATDEARAVAESALQVASMLPEVSALLQHEAGAMASPVDVLAELQSLRDGARPNAAANRERQVSATTTVLRVRMPHVRLPRAAIVSRSRSVPSRRLSCRRYPGRRLSTRRRARALCARWRREPDGDRVAVCL